MNAFCLLYRYSTEEERESLLLPTDLPANMLLRVALLALVLAAGCIADDEELSALPEEKMTGILDISECRLGPPGHGSPRSPAANPAARGGIPRLRIFRNNAIVGLSLAHGRASCPPAMHGCLAAHAAATVRALALRAAAPTPSARLINALDAAWPAAHSLGRPYALRLPQSPAGAAGRLDQTLPSMSRLVPPHAPSSSPG
jgi:hypothetical protein